MSLTKRTLIAILCLFLAFAGALLLGACGDNPDDNPDDPGIHQPGNPNDEDTVKDYIMEAENIDLGDLTLGATTSGNASGAGLIKSLKTASGGEYIGDLYNNGCIILFDFESDAAVDDAVLTFSFAGEIREFTLNNDELQIYINPTLNETTYAIIDESERIMYKEITLDPFAGFKEYEISTSLSIRKGSNLIYMLVNNNESLLESGGTANAKAPLIDYMKITTSATLTHITYENV